MDIQPLLGFSFHRKAKINYLHKLCLSVKQDIVHLEVSVGLVLRMHVGNTMGNLSENCFAQRFPDALLLLHLLAELHAWAQLHH